MRRLAKASVGCTRLPAIDMSAHNKSLQLSPWILLRTVDSARQSRQCRVDAAGQLNSMLGSRKVLPIRVSYGE